MNSQTHSQAVIGYLLAANAVHLPERRPSERSLRQQQLPVRGYQVGDQLRSWLL